MRAQHPPRRPTWAFLLEHPAHVFGLGFGSGLSPKAPGTAGTLWAWLTWAALQWAGCSTVWLWALALLSVPLGWWACTRTASDLGVEDPGCVVWDEVAGFWLLLCAIQAVLPQASAAAGGAGLGWQALAFGLFRVWDAAKPPPVGWADRVFKGRGWRGGWGIMFDDLVAALCAGLCWLALAMVAGLTNLTN